MDHIGLDPGVPKTGKRTRYKLKNHPDWEEWKESEFYHLDALDKDIIFGCTFIITLGAIVLIQVWKYVIKKPVKRKARNIFDESNLTGKGIQYANNYAACAYQYELNIFLVLYTALLYIIMADDAI